MANNVAVPFCGGCACGAIRYECSTPPLRMVNCHCRDCQRASGSGYSATLVVPASAVRLLRGACKEYRTVAESGSIAKREFCALCGTPLFAASLARPEFVGIKAASLDDPSWFAAEADVWVASAQPWDHMDPRIPKVAKNRPQADNTQRLVHDMTPHPFLTAEWRYLAMLNFEIDPTVRRPLVPAGTELDEWRGRTLLSVVGFLFLNTRVLGMPIPFHRNFEEVNLRFYVRRKMSDGWRRAVVFVKELVPRSAIALTARMVYGENYVALPMSHRIEIENGSHPAIRRVFYCWKFNERENQIRMTVQGEAREIEPGSEAEFITEHYWGYTRRRDGSTREYRVEHPRWRVWTAMDAQLDCDTARLYGDQFVESLQASPASAFLADGSEVTVSKGISLPVGREQ